MNTELEQALREGMERFTHGMGVPEGLAHKADRHRQNRRTARVLAAAGTAAIMTATGAVLASAPGPGARPPIQPVADVIGRAEHALAASARGCGQIMYQRTSYSRSPYYVEPIPGGWRSSAVPAGSLPRAAATTEWESCHSYVQTVWSATGQPIFTEEITKTSIPYRIAKTPAGAKLYESPAGATVAVLYGPRAWWRTGLTVAALEEGLHRVTTIQWGHLLPMMSWDLAGGIRDQVTHHYLRIVGRQRIDGVETIKLVQVDTHSTGSALWVNAKTYLPVRTQDPGGTVTTDFRLLPATPANLARLHVTVPRGFRQVPPPKVYNTLARVPRRFKEALENLPPEVLPPAGRPWR
jgi:hypothetical protein